MRYLRIRRPLIFLTVLWIVLYRDTSGLVRIGFLAALLHECGHILAWILLTGKLPVLRLSLLGIGLDTGGEMLRPIQLLLLAAAGPLTNGLLCLLTLEAMQIRASYWGFFFAAANGLLAIFNLLPFGMLDGKQIWTILCGLHLQLRRK